MTKRSFWARLFPLVSLVCFLFTFTIAHGFAQASSASEAPASARIRALNNALLNLHGQMQQATPGESRLLRAQGVTAIAQRQLALARLIQNDPRSALTFAFSPELLADLAAKFPQSAPLLESHVTLTGEAQHWIADYPGLRSSRSIWQMNSAAGTINLYFAGREPLHLAAGESLQVKGVISGSLMAVESSSVVPSASASVAPAPSSKISPLASLVLLSFGFAFALGRPTGLSRKRAANLLRHLTLFALVFTLIASLSTSAYTQNSCTTKGAQNTAVLLVNLPNGTLPSGVTQSSMQDAFFATNTPGESVDGFLREASYGQASATGDVFGPYNLTGTYTSCSDVGGAILNDAIAYATSAGLNLNNYSRVFLVFPDIFGCGWAGYATNACSIVTPTATYNASVAYLAAAYATPRAQGVQVASHEMGHNLGLLHSGTIGDGTEALGPITAAGTYYDMGDYWSTLGAPALGLYPAPQKAEVTGWMTSGTNFLTVQNSGTYTLQPLETNPPGLQALKVQRGTGNNAWLWIEYRQPLGNYDSTLFTQPFSGALIHYEDSNTALGHTYLPNFTPSDTSGNSPALATGQSWQDPYSNLSISVVSATASGLTVSVNYGGVPCTPANPTVSVSPADPSANVGSNAAYSVTIQNNDSAGCSSNTFNVGSSLPSGWPTSFSTGSVTLSPGNSASVTMYKTGPAGTSPGTYAVNASAANSNYAGSGTANITLTAPPSLTITAAVPATSYIRPSTVPIAATVLNGGAPVSGAAVTFTMVSPNGSATTQTATTASNGIATWNYKAGTRSSAGSYWVSGKATVTSGSKKNATSQSANSNSVSFSLQ